MEIIVVGLDCQQAPVEVREQLSFPEPRLAEAYAGLTDLAPVEEAVILSTCNRVELYLLSQHAGQVEATRLVREFLSDFHHLPEEVFTPYLFQMTGRAACQHLFEVACGLQSMVLGEPQIQGQVREALDLAREHKGAGRVMEALFRGAITTGKRARTETAISESGISVSFTAVELLGNQIGNLTGKHALIIGSGKTGRLTGQIVADRKIGTLTMINRNLAHARETAHLIDFPAITVRPFDNLVASLAEADVVISCTAAPHAVITRADLEAAMQGRINRPLYLVDIAVPRDVEPEAADLPGVHVWDIDDIKGLAEANLARRQGEVGQVRAIVEQELDTFTAWMGALAVVPTITTLRRHADTIRRTELNRTLQALGPLSERETRLLDDLTSRIVNKLLHEPTLRLKQVSASQDAGRYAEVVRHLFALQGTIDEQD